MDAQDYHSKGLQYFDNPRKDIIPLMPKGAKRILEIGCGTGVSLAHLKALGLAEEVHGMEWVKLEEAHPGVDHWFWGDAVSALERLEDGAYDAILCLDFLEHLEDPWTFLGAVKPKLTPSGCLIASLPNLRRVKVLWNLAVRGRFDYAEEGIMDRTHLRFFTRKSALELMNSGGFEVDMWRHSPFDPGSKGQFINALTIGLFRDFFTIQYLIRSVQKHD
ncbi:class I SAM-dependent methyltransferase [Schleiferiaceae bacterium]|nr:class I SAM-dependent methyltransferase [Schleiferiaceae bacterium]